MPLGPRHAPGGSLVKILSLFRRQPPPPNRQMSPGEARQVQTVVNSQVQHARNPAAPQQQQQQQRQQGNGRQAPRHGYLATHGIEKSFGGRTVVKGCLLYTSPSPRDTERSRMPSSA